MVTEEGIFVSDGVLEKFQFNTFDSRIINFGAQHYPINLYGDNGQKEQ